MAYGILIPQPGFEPIPPAVEVRSLNHWTAREVPKNGFNKLMNLSNTSFCNLNWTLESEE